ncbi:methyl-accepting chemotaxis protein [Clostridium ganghwense]|uniref:Methyl-accepting chemotaxis protein n=1 Tax=Clostridium ganghwense TaxID=312089 RepID=A0ABT4CJT5_9CLOT|nr:methyl-accepting chemotaxis protein [Clostridium ganghwense]
MKKISYSIVLAISLCCVILSLTIGGICLFNSKKIIKYESEQKLLKMAEQITGEFNKSILKAQASGENVLSLIDASFDLNKALKDKSYMNQYEATISPMIKKITEDTEGVMSIYVGFNPKFSGTYHQIWYADTKANGVYTLQPKINVDDYWETDKVFWSEPYIDDTTHICMISYTAPIKSGKNTIGILSVDLKYDDIKKYINDVKVYNEGYAFLCDSKFKFYVHKNLSNKEYMNKYINNEGFKKAMEQIKKNKSGIIYYNIDGVNKILSYAKSADNNILGIEIPENDIFKDLNSLIFLISTVIIIGIIISILVAFYIGNKITKPINEVTNIINRISELDLTFNEDIQKILQNKDETGVITRSVENLKGKLRVVIGNLQKEADETFEYSKIVSKSTEGILGTMENISCLIESLAQGAEKQAQKSQSGSEKLTYFADDINEASTIANKVKEYSSNTNIVSRQGIEAIDNLQDKFEANNKSINRAFESVGALANSSEHIGQIINSIESIASETNLLALNAAIEAARAGEAGKGFAVVADQIRKLSEQTTLSAKEIETIINEIKTEASNTKNDMGDVNKALSEVNKSVEESKQAFKVIGETIENTISHINILVKKINTVNENKDDVLKSTKEISAISQESAASTEEIAAAIQEQVISIQNISKASEKLGSVVDSLEQISKQFII